MRKVHPFFGQGFRMAFLLFPLLCGLATVSFTACAKHPRHVIHWLIGFLSVLLLTGSWIGQNRGLVLVDPTHAATVLGLAAFAILHKSQWASAAVVFGGMMGAVWISSLTASGYPWLLVSIVICLVSVVAFIGATGWKNFVSDEVLDEALIIVIAVSLFVSIVPTAISGWQSAANLTALDSGQNEPYANVGLLILSLTFIVVGGLYGKWKYR